MKQGDELGRKRGAYAPASTACLWAATSSIALEQVCGLSGPPEIVLTISLSWGTEWRSVAAVVAVHGCLCVCVRMLAWAGLLPATQMDSLLGRCWRQHTHSLCVCCVSLATLIPARLAGCDEHLQFSNQLLRLFRSLALILTKNTPNESFASWWWDQDEPNLVCMCLRLHYSSLSAALNAC